MRVSFLFLFFAPLLSWADSDTPTEHYLRSGTEFPGIENVESPYEFLQSHLRELTERLQREPHNNNRIQLEIGDTLHWLGHIAEERGQLFEATQHFADALRAYRESNILTSPRINDLVTLEHMAEHFGRIYTRILSDIDPDVSFLLFTYGVLAETANKESDKYLRQSCLRYFTTVDNAFLD